MNSYRLQRRNDEHSPWKDTKHVFSADSENGALRAFNLPGAFANSKARIVTAHRSGRQYRAVLVESNPALAALKRNISGKVASGEAEPITAIEEAPYGYRKDGTPKSKPGRKPFRDTPAPVLTPANGERVIIHAHGNSSEATGSNLSGSRAAGKVSGRVKGSKSQNGRTLSADERKLLEAADAIIRGLDNLRGDAQQLGFL